MPIFFKSSSSKTVDESSLVVYQQNKLLPEEKEKDACTSLTIWRKSLLFSCKGFTVIGCDGNLKYRVDCYNGRRPTQVILMDESGHPLLTLSRKKKLGLVDIWLIYEGEENEDPSSCNNNKNQTKKPIFVFKRNKSILRPGNMNVLANIYRGMNEKRYSYVIEGSYVNRSCRILEDPTKRVVAEVKNKETMKGGSVSFGLEVFLLIVKSGFDSKFAMAFILLLDQMFA